MPPLARLKAEVSVRRLVEGCGVVLHRQSKDLVGASLLHEDDSPSLVVTPGRNLWHCLDACGRGGGPVGQGSGIEVGESFRVWELGLLDPADLTAEIAFVAFSGQNPQGVRKDALHENPSTCVYCRMETDRPQVDHAIPRSRGGNATLENAQTTGWWCNASKGARDFPVNPPPGFEGMWPPSWWLLP